MSKREGQDYAEYMRVTADERNRIVRLRDLKLALPAVNVFDSPVRCFKVNHEWWKIIHGAVSLLLELDAWQNADDESYSGIQQILEFLEGMDCFDCDDVENCLGTSPIINVIETDITNVQNSITNNLVTIDESTTTVTQVFPPSEQIEPIGGEVPAPIPPDECNMDAVWAACWSMVSYINQQNVDFLQQLVQAANYAQQAAKLISAIPFIGLFPADEILDYVGFLVDELYQEYQAIVTTALLQGVACDLFCIAINNSDCSLHFDDLINYFSSKVAPSAGQAADTFSDLVQFGLTGTFATDDYFYYLCYFQLWVAYAGQEFLGQRGVTQYAIAAKAGYNSPDNDWTLYCAECPLPYYEIYYNFADGNAVPPCTYYEGQYIAPYWHGQNLANERLVYLGFSFSQEQYHDSVEVEYKHTGSAAGSGRDLVIQGIGTFPMTYSSVVTTEEYQLGAQVGGITKFRGTSNRLTYSTNIDVYSVRWKGHGYVPANIVPYMIQGVPE